MEAELFSLFKKKPPAYPTETKWSVLKGERRGKPMFARRNDTAAALAGHPEYRYRVGVAVPLKAPNEHGFPTKDEMEVLNRIENSLTAGLEVGQQAILVLAITTGGMREFVFYTRDPAGARTVIESLQAATTSHEIQSYIAEDPKWQGFKHFT
jgi:hypothetical protein